MGAALLGVGVRPISVLRVCVCYCGPWCTPVLGGWVLLMSTSMCKCTGVDKGVWRAERGLGSPRRYGNRPNVLPLSCMLSVQQSPSMRVTTLQAWGTLAHAW